MDEKPESLCMTCYIAIPVLIFILYCMPGCAKRAKKFFKFCVLLYDDKLMEETVPYKVFLYWGDGSKPELRRFSMEKAVFGKIRPLKAKLRDVYPKLKQKKFILAWKDEDGDEILMSTDAEVKTMLYESSDTVLKLTVRVTGPRDHDDDDIAEVSASTSAVDATPTIPDKTEDCLHPGISCNGCGEGISGFRYKCITCDDFDLCGRCERDGKHPEHWVVRVPIPNMSVPLIKASIKKSRRFLKSFATQAHEENKRLRRERGRHSTDATIQGKQDSQPGRSRNWTDIFAKYLEEFTNLAGDFGLYAEKKSETVEAETNEAGTSAETGPKSALIDEEISLNPWNLPLKDLEKLQDAMHTLDALGVTPKLGGKMFVLDPTDVLPHRKNNGSGSRAWLDRARLENPGQVADLLAKISAGRRARQMAAMNEEVEANTQQEALKEQQEPAQEASSSGRVSSTDSAKMPAQTEGILKITLEKQTVSLKGLPEDNEAKTISVKRCDVSELVNAVTAAKSGLSSNASSCSSETHGSEKAEGWTVIDPCENAVKDLLDNTDNYPANMLDLTEETQERNRFKASIYPSLNAATAVLDPKEDVATATAPPMPTNNAAQAAKAAKAAQVAAAAQALRDQLAPHVEAAVRQMEAMGFSNESGWLTQLLDHNDGNIATVLDLITPGIPPPKHGVPKPRRQQ